MATPPSHLASSLRSFHSGAFVTFQAKSYAFTLRLLNFGPYLSLQLFTFAQRVSLHLLVKSVINLSDTFLRTLRSSYSKHHNDLSLFRHLTFS